MGLFRRCLFCRKPIGNTDKDQNWHFAMKCTKPYKNEKFIPSYKVDKKRKWFSKKKHK